MRTRTAAIVSIVLAASFAPGCAADGHAKGPLPAPKSDLPAAKGAGPQTAVFAGGCFWCIEAAFDRVAGVTDVVSGYAGGTRESADYERVGAGTTNHAESVQITYDPSKVSYGQLLRVFFTVHDPTTKDRQGPDWGRQYRSAIFYATPAQKEVAAAYLRQLDEARLFDAPLVTTIEPLGAGFFRAEAYHQDFVKLHPEHPYVRQWFPGKKAKLQTVRELLKPEFRDEK